MHNTYKDKGLTGKSARKMTDVKAQALLAPVVERESLEVESNVINDATKSGKQPGSMVIMHNANKFSMAVAATSGEQGFWFTVAAASVVQHTPA